MGDNLQGKMPLISVNVFYIWLSLLSFVLGHFEHNELPKVLLISMDGFRWDYMNRFTSKDLPNLYSFREQGVYAREGLKNVFPTKTFPNHFSIVTGLYVESHGIVNNFFYDPKFNESFYISNPFQATESKWFDMGAEPIWVTNQKNGNSRKTGIANFPCSEAPIKNYLPSSFLIYDRNLPERAKINTLINWFTVESPINLGLLYFAEPDASGHHFGPNSKEVNDKIREYDGVLGYLFNKLKSIDLFDHLNIIITSDHGMTETPPEKRIFLNEYTDLSKFNLVGGYIIAYINPHDGYLDEVYKSLKKIPHCSTYKKSEIPERYHYRNNRRITEIIIVADEGYTILRDKFDNYTNAGGHGYDNELRNMHPFFLARGPAFKENFSIQTFSNLDIYPLLCHLLRVTPSPNNGSLKYVSSLLKEKPEENGSSIAIIYFVVIPLCAALSGVCCIAACCQFRSKFRSAHFTNNIPRSEFQKINSSTDLLSESDDEIRDPHHPMN